LGDGRHPGQRARDRGGQLQRRRDPGRQVGASGPAGARQGRNDYTGWFANDPDMGGAYRGYDGPYPPFNDLRLHRYFFRLFALRVPKLALPDDFTAADVFHALQPHEITEAAIYATYSLNPKVTG
jgi:phosphatidylethanolamine-binding protein (PEBP) family uncharacterized protein